MIKTLRILDEVAPTKDIATSIRAIDPVVTIVSSEESRLLDLVDELLHQRVQRFLAIRAGLTRESRGNHPTGWRTRPGRSLRPLPPMLIP
ncbi:hypothetical protein [uncultured Thiodictyon sp.]|uniref:hypothetical protein n=1 Tax=uncultured Thiodictyon sp. TaxID=1846217 RepID=UPI0025F165AE|nr:hypothetical protein [uncultured Thiodictyon sp.]